MRREGSKLYIMSIRPQFAEAIFAGRKRLELRRADHMKLIEEGSIVILYVSGSVRAVQGQFKAGRVYFGRPHEIWRLAFLEMKAVGPEAKAYIDGSSWAMAIEILEPRKYAESIPLKKIRRVIPDWSPPLSFRELGPGEPFYELIVSQALDIGSGAERAW